MCKVRDVALAVLQKSIRLAIEKKDERYYMDYVKLHKLLYLGQCMVLAQYNLTLFNERITAHHCGPYIQDELDFVTAAYGFEEIKTLRGPDGKEPIILPLPVLRDEIVNKLLDTFGTYTTGDIVKMSKQTVAYTRHRGNYDNKPVICPDDMVQVGNMLLTESA